MQHNIIQRYFLNNEHPKIIKNMVLYEVRILNYIRWVFQLNKN